MNVATLQSSTALNRRGIIGSVRAEAQPKTDTTDVTKLIDGVQRAFNEFKDVHTRELAEIKNGQKDVVTTEKLERINADLGAMQKTIDELNAALKLGAGSGAANDNGPTREQLDHAKAFEKFFRKGMENGLKDLEVKAGLTSSVDPDGGYLVPTQMEATIDRVLTRVSAMRSLASRLTISTDTYEKLVNVGGAGYTWVGETEAPGETTTPVLKQLLFSIMTLAAEPHATQQVLDDAAVNLEQWLAGEVAISFADGEGDAFINGSGNKKPRGILQYTNVANASYAWGSVGYIKTGHASAFITPTSSASPADCLIDLVYALKQGYRSNATWLMNDLIAASVRKFKNADGDFIWQPSLQAGQPATILGYGMATDDNMPNLGANAFPIAFADFQRAYLILDRLGIRVLRDPYTRKPYIKFYTTKRVGGGIQNFEAIKLLKCEA